MKHTHKPYGSRSNWKVVGGVLLTLSAATFAAEAAKGPQPSICTRSCWSARASTGCSSTIAALTRAIIHHTAVATDYSTSLTTSKAKVRGIQNYHIDSNGWCDIGYHFVVDAAGNIFEGRVGSMTSLIRGAHDGNNTDSFGFNLMGNFETQNPSAVGRDALYDVIAWRMPSIWSPYGSGSYNGNTVGYLDGHNKVKATACPGSNFYNPYITGTFSGGEARNGVNCRKNGSCNAVAPKAKPAVFREGDWYLRNSLSGGSAGTIFNYGIAGDQPVMGDWDGNGTVTSGIFRNGTWYLRNSNSGGSDYIFDYGAPGDLAVAGDWDGNGKTSIGIFRPGEGAFYLRNTLSAGPTDYNFSYGTNGDLPVAGDWDGNGKTSVGILRGATWYLRNALSAGGSDYVFDYGAPGDRPVAGDWDADGKDSVGVFRPSDAGWYLRNSLSAGGSNFNFNYGISTDLPVIWY